MIIFYISISCLNSYFVWFDSHICKGGFLFFWFFVFFVYLFFCFFVFLFFCFFVFLFFCFFIFLFFIFLFFCFALLYTPSFYILNFIKHIIIKEIYIYAVVPPTPVFSISVYVKRFIVFYSKDIFPISCNTHSL